MMRRNLFGLEVDDLTRQETVSAVDEYIQNGKPAHLLGVNSDKVNAIQDDLRLLEICKKAAIVNPDGISMVLASRMLKQALPERVAGIDLMDDLLNLATQKGYSVYFIGAKEAVIRQAVTNIEAKYPTLKVLGYENGYFGSDVWSQKAAKLKDIQADMVFIGITSPQKEYFIQSLMDADVSAIFMGVGGSFDVISGKLSRAPRWMQMAGLEWFYRFLQEPRRMWRRYFFGNLKFINLTIKEARSIKQ